MIIDRWRIKIKASAPLDTCLHDFMNLRNHSIMISFSLKSYLFFDLNIVYNKDTLAEGSCGN